MAQRKPRSRGWLKRQHLPAKPAASSKVVKSPVGSPAHKHQALRRSSLGFRVAHHRHSGRWLPWHYTSYAIIYFLIVLTAFLMLFSSQFVRADEQSLQGAIILGGTVQGPAPTEPAIITSPKNNDRFQDNIVRVEGECTQNLFVELYRDGQYTGQVMCSSAGSFEIEITIVPGANQLMARIKDSANQYGPDSEKVTVFYDVPEVPLEGSSQQPDKPVIPAPLLIRTPVKPIGSFVNKPMKLQYEVDGGEPAYAVSINWGDSSRESVFSIDKPGDYKAEHTYKEKGQFTVSISASDKNGKKAFLQTVVIVAGAEAVPGVVATACQFDTGCIAYSRIVEIIERYLWPALLIALLMTFSFWVGERVVYTRMPHQKA